MSLRSDSLSGLDGRVGVVEGGGAASAIDGLFNQTSISIYLARATLRRQEYIFWRNLNAERVDAQAP